jgi:hypothetical protein
LQDAALLALSADQRFATAYNAALQTAKTAIACAGYRVASGPGHHRLHFEAARIALGPSAQRFLDFFEMSRRKRNLIDYDYASVATDTPGRRNSPTKQRRSGNSWVVGSKRNIPPLFRTSA